MQTYNQIPRSIRQMNKEPWNPDASARLAACGNENYGGLDYFRLAAALLVVAVHTSPLTSVNVEADFFFTRVLARVAVPFFFMVTGHFMLSGLFAEGTRERARCARRVKKYLLRLCIFYCASIVLYLPLGVYAGHYRGLTLPAFLRMLLFDGTFYHLWYFPACILGVLLVLLISRFLQLKTTIIISALLYLVGLFGDSYFGLIENVPVLNTIYEAMFHLFSYTRNGLFLAPIFLVLGILAGSRAAVPSSAGVLRLPIRSLFLVLSFCAMTAEAFLLRRFDLSRHDSMYFFLIPVSFFLYCCLLSVPAASRKPLRTASTWIYILHPAFIVAVRGAGKLLHLTDLLVDNSMLHYLAVSCLSVAAGLSLTCLGSFLRKNTRQTTARIPLHNSPKGLSFGEADSTLTANFPLEENDSELTEKLSLEESDGELTDGLSLEENDDTLTDDFPFEENDSEPVNDFSLKENALRTLQARNVVKNPLSLTSGAGDISCRPGTERAWIELDLAALEHNVRFLQSCIPAHCRLMPAVKADAYGHGAEIIAGELNRLGINDFCVACVSEGIALREAGIRGQILILGYTHPSQFPLLGRYRLTQTVVDLPYAEQMQRSGLRLHVHIALDTGMHRLGIRCESPEEILSVYRMKNLFVDGIFTHLSSCDSSTPPCRAFTESQIEAFYQTVNYLKEAGCDCHGLHLLSSYGIINYPDAAEDYVRPGIALYGTLSSAGDPFSDFLRPVLSLKARVASVRVLQPGEPAGYGMDFTAQKTTKIAVLSVGYADGLPRELSSGAGSALIKGRRVPVIGRICMDQTLVDVSGLPDVSPHDTAVLIGDSDGQQITAEEMAGQCNTIANEILSRLGARLPRFSIEKSRTS